MTHNKPSLLRQLLGAAIGSAIALALYYSFKVATPLVSAYITLPQAERQSDLSDVSTNGDVSLEQLKRMESRNARLGETIEANQNAYNNPWQTEWPTETPEPNKADAPIEHTSAPEAPAVEEDGWEDFLRDTAPVEAPKAEMADTVQTRSSPPALPDSGLGAVALMISAIGAATGYRTQSRKK